MKKQIDKSVKTGSNNVQSTISVGQSTKAQRIRQRATREEISENHGASKRVKITVETCVESLERHTSDNSLSQDNIMISEEGIIVPAAKSATDADFVLADDCESVTDNMEYAKTEVKALSQKGNIVSASNLQDINKLLKNGMSLKAKEMLTVCDKVDSTNDIVPIGGQVVSCSYEKKTDIKDNIVTTRNRYNSEYVDNPQFTPNLDFSMFADLKKFKNTICLKGKLLKDCIVTFNKAQFKKVKDHNRIHELLTYILLLENEYNIDLKTEVIGESFLSYFECYLYNKGLAPNSVYVICYKLKQIVKWASHYGVNIQYDIDNWKSTPEDAKPKIALTEDDIIRIYWFDIKSLPFRKQKKKTMEKVRDHFVLSCFIGQRFSDTSRFNKENFKGSSSEIFDIKQQKTGAHAVLKFNDIYGSFPICARRLLEKYNYCSPWNGDISNYNRYLRELMQLIGFNEEVKHEYKVKGQMITKYFKQWELISSHTSRRSFITNAVKRNVNNQVVKLASGHKSDSSFGKYVLLNM